VEGTVVLKLVQAVDVSACCIAVCLVELPACRRRPRGSLHELVHVRL
jgi:hypothetical protein